MSLWKFNFFDFLYLVGGLVEVVGVSSLIKFLSMPLSMLQHCILIIIWLLVPYKSFSGQDILASLIIKKLLHALSWA